MIDIMAALAAEEAERNTYPNGSFFEFRTGRTLPLPESDVFYWVDSGGTVRGLDDLPDTEYDEFVYNAEWRMAVGDEIITYTPKEIVTMLLNHYNESFLPLLRVHWAD